jgi:beta-lactamase regulating signal transducer with metallopeptidase domain/uncharacterized membrane protein YkoI
MARISEAILLFLLNAAWQAALVALLVSAGDRLLRRAAARYRHALWVAALATCIALTLSVSLRMSPVSAGLHSRGSASANRQSRQTATVTLPVERSESTGDIIANAQERHFAMRPIVGLSSPVALAIVSLYGVLVLYRLGMLAKAWTRTRTLVGSARRAEVPEPTVQALARCRHAFGLGPVALLSSSRIAVPVTAGILRPAVILPESLLHDGDIQLLTSALGHETAHIARRDYLLNLVYEIASLPLWFHPAIRLLLLRIRQTRELRCDELVAQRLLEPVIYAKSLVQLAGAALPFGRPAATVTVGIADADILEERIMNILKYSSARPRRPGVLLFIAAMLFIVPCIAASSLTLHVAVHPATRAAVGQAGANPGSTSPSNPASPPETIKVLTPQGEVIVLTVTHRPEVGEVLTIDGRRLLKITQIDAGGQYRGSLVRNKVTSYVIRENARTGELEPQTIELIPAEGKRLVEVVEVNEAARAALAQLEQKREQARQQGLPTQEIDVQVVEARRKVEDAMRARLVAGQLELSPEARRKVEAAMLFTLAANQLELARQAKIAIDQAIQIANRQAPGIVMEARLIGERGTVTYLISILQQNPNGNEMVQVLVNAVDGSILETGTKK